MTDIELSEFIEHGEDGFAEFALVFGDGWASQAIEIAKELRRLHEVNAKLVESFSKLMSDIDEGIVEVDTMRNANSALAKATGEHQ